MVTKSFYKVGNSRNYFQMDREKAPGIDDFTIIKNVGAHSRRIRRGFS